MKRASPYIAAGLLLAAIVARAALPSGSTQPASRTGPAERAEENADLPPAVPSEPVLVTINAADYLAERNDGFLPPDLPEEMERAVETFLDEQAPYEELGIPADASYACPIPEFPVTRPVRAEVSSSFGYRIHPLENLTKFHYGTDLAALSGDDIVSFARGKVTDVGYDETNGNYIRVEHPDGYETLYAHCGTIYVSEGDPVQMGQKLALVGISGKVTGPHLHFELTRNGIHLNPEYYLAAA